MTTAQHANLQRRFNRAHARTKRIVDKYCEYVNGKAFQLAPQVKGDKPIVIDECTRDTQFLSFWASDPVTHERRVLYVKAYDNGYGYTEWRKITPTEWRKIEKLECAILDAWDAENDLWFQLKQ